MLIYTVTTGKGGRPQTFTDIYDLRDFVFETLRDKALTKKPGKVIIEVKLEGDAK